MTNQLDIFVIRYGGGWITEAYAHNTNQPVPVCKWRTEPLVYATPEEALAALPARYRARAVTTEICR